jgi:hypothetical protein
MVMIGAVPSLDEGSKKFGQRPGMFSFSASVHRAPARPSAPYNFVTISCCLMHRLATGCYHLRGLVALLLNYRFCKKKKRPEDEHEGTRFLFEAQLGFFP